MAEETKNPLEMSDEDFMNMIEPADTPPAEPSPSSEPKEEPPKEEEKSSEENTNENKNTGEEDLGKGDESTGAEETPPEPQEEQKQDIGNSDNPPPQEEKIQDQPKDKEPESVGQQEETPAKINYKAFYEQVMAPFKANGKTIVLKNPQEAVQLMQMGANYTRKMQDLAPYRKHLIMLQNNGLLDENKLNFLIDLDKHKVEAIKKLVKDAGIDPMDINPEEEPKYTPGQYRVSNEEVAFTNAVEDLSSTIEGKETLREINSNWDEASKDILWKSPEIMQTIHQQRMNGVYEKITTEMEKDRMLGVIPPNMPFIAAYKQTGDKLVAALQSQKPIETRAKTVKPAVSNNARAKAAAPTRTTTSSASKKMPNPLAMSDEEFMKQFEGRI